MYQPNTGLVLLKYSINIVCFKTMSAHYIYCFFLSDPRAATQLIFVQRSELCVVSFSIIERIYPLSKLNFVHTTLAHLPIRYYDFSAIPISWTIFVYLLLYLLCNLYLNVIFYIGTLHYSTLIQLGTYHKNMPTYKTWSSSQL